MSRFIYVEVVNQSGNPVGTFWVDAEDRGAMSKLLLLITVSPAINRSVHCIPVTKHGEIPSAVVVGGDL